MSTRSPLRRRRQLRLAARLARAGSPLAAVKWLSASLRGSMEPMDLSLGGKQVQIRPATADLDEALRGSQVSRRKFKYSFEKGRADKVRSEDGALAAWRYLWAGFTGQEMVQVTIRGVQVHIRPLTTDIDVVLDSLGGEFDELIDKVPAARHGLIVDAGGYIGTAAIVFARAFPDATVVTLEPSAENFALLQKNVAPYANIKPLNAALSSESGTMQFFDRGTGHWGLTLVGDAQDNATRAVGETEVVTVTDILQRFGKDGIDIIKIDIEGGEHALFSANIEWVEKTEAICIELHDRIVPGCTEAYERVAAGRQNSKLEGEKFFSIREQVGK